jgi:hypothetical protein
MTKNIKVSFFATLVMAVLCAGTVSARQLSLTVQTTTCRGFCSKKVGCANILGCACVFQQPNFPDSGTCNFIAAKPQSPAK